MLLLLLSRFSNAWLCATPETAAHQAPPSLGFSRQEHWSGLPFPSPIYESEKWKWSRSVVSDSSQPHGLQPTRLLRPWDFPGKSTGVGCHCLLWSSHARTSKVYSQFSFFFPFPSPPLSLSLFQYPSTYFYLFSESTQTPSHPSPLYANRKILSLLALSPAWQLPSTHATITEARAPESPCSAKERSHCNEKSAHHN